MTEAEGFIVVNEDFRILTANKAYCNQVGECGENIIGRHCYEVSHKTTRPCYEEGEDCAVRHVFATGDSHVVIHRHKDSAGNMLFVETKGYPIKDESGKVSSVIDTINNIFVAYLTKPYRLEDLRKTLNTVLV